MENEDDKVPTWFAAVQNKIFGWVVAVALALLVYISTGIATEMGKIRELAEKADDRARTAAAELKAVTVTLDSHSRLLERHEQRLDRLDR